MNTTTKILQTQLFSSPFLKLSHPSQPHHFPPSPPPPPLPFLSPIRSSSNNDNNTPLQPPPDTLGIKFRRGSKKRRKQLDQDQLQQPQQSFYDDDDDDEGSTKKDKAVKKKNWEEMNMSEKAIELYMGEKGFLFWVNKFAYASIFIIIGAWILFRFVGPAFNLYQLDSPPLSPESVFKGS